ncbi:hypothetical protein OG767_10685 [Micromonospora sp. NBC_01392]|uniref:hypothetical protein n=1 Tax=Micromonospora sp. NBC_01392 TaxID=2903588 RepID=UPI003247B58A
MTEPARIANASGAGSVAVAGDVVNSTITTYATTVPELPIEVAFLDPAPIFADLETDRFVGREWLVVELDDFLRRHACGYLWLEADAGVGKSAVAARLVSDRGWLCHFARQSSGRSAVARQNLAAQVLRRFPHTGLAAAGTVPAWATTPEGFGVFLASAASRLAATGERIVLVIDGLDELDGEAHQLPLGLPAVLPEGVFVIGTYRTGHPPAVADSAHTTLTIAAQDERNRADLRTFLDRAVREPPLRHALDAAGVDRQQFIDRLAVACQGIWIYLRYLLAEIKLGLRGFDDIDDLPGTLWDYYLRQIHHWRAGHGWEHRLPILGVLTAVDEPITAQAVADLTDGEVAAVRRFCDGPLRPFLTVAGRPRAYRIYHVSLRQFLNGRLPTGPTPDDREVVAAELTDAVRQAHSRCADACQVAPVSFGDGYVARHLVRHLAASGRMSEVHDLLARGSTDADGRPANLWYATHLAAASGDTYLLDVGSALADAVRAVDTALAAGQPPQRLPEELRYRLIQVSVHDIANRIPAALPGALVGDGLWELSRAATLVRWMTQPTDRARALAGLCPYAPEPDRPSLVAEALVSANAIPVTYANAWDIAAALGQIAAVAPPALLDRVWEAACRIRDHDFGPWIRAVVLPHLPLPERRTATAEALGSDFGYLGALIPILVETAPDPARLLRPRLNLAELSIDALRELKELLPAAARPEVLAAYHRTGNLSEPARSTARATLTVLLNENERSQRCRKLLTAYGNEEASLKIAPDLLRLVPPALHPALFDRIRNDRGSMDITEAVEEDMAMASGHTADWNDVMARQQILAERLVCVADLLPDDILDEAVSRVAASARGGSHHFPLPLPRLAQAAAVLPDRHLPVLITSAGPVELAVLASAVPEKHLDAVLRQAHDDPAVAAAVVPRITDPVRRRTLLSDAINRVMEPQKPSPVSLAAFRNSPPPTTDTPQPSSYDEPDLAVIARLIDEAPRLDAGNILDRAAILARTAWWLTPSAVAAVGPGLRPEALEEAMRQFQPDEQTKVAPVMVGLAAAAPGVGDFELLAFLRRMLPENNRATFMEMLDVAASRLARIAGPAHATTCATAIEECFAWW